MICFLVWSSAGHPKKKMQRVSHRRGITVGTYTLEFLNLHTRPS